MAINWCEIIKLIAANPTSRVLGMTDERYAEARKHIETCKKCDRLIDQVLDSAPKYKIELSEN